MKPTSHKKQNPMSGNSKGFANFFFTALIALDGLLIALVIIAIVQYFGG